MHTKFKLLLALPLVVGLEQTHACFSCDWFESDQYKTRIISNTFRGPNPYDQAYSSTNPQNTLITIKDFRIRTNDGRLIVVTTNPMQFDFQNLTAFQKGIEMDLTNVSFADNTIDNGGPAPDVLQVREIETTVISDAKTLKQNNLSANQVVFGQPVNNVSTCNLQKFNLITFYRHPNMSFDRLNLRHDLYRLKIGFTALNSIQLDLHQMVTRKYNCSSDCYYDDDEGGKKSIDWKRCSAVGQSTTTTTLECGMVNRRQPMLDVVRPKDEG